MFVSSYNTYIATNSSQKIEKERLETQKTSSTAFKSKLLKAESKDVVLANTKLPLNYISNYKALNNRQQIQEQNLAKSAEKTKFTKINSMTNAKVAYTENSTMFSFLVKPKTTLDQTPRLDTRLPTPALEGQENAKKNIMVNTYIANENYYKITA